MRTIIASTSRPSLCLLLILSLTETHCFLGPRPRKIYPSSALTATATSSTTDSDELAVQKKRLLQLLQADPRQDPVLADPITKEPITIARKSTVLGGTPGGKTKFELKSPSNTYVGYSDSYLDLLQPAATAEDSPDDNTNKTTTSIFARNLVPFIPPPLRSALATAGLPMGEEYIPMRDLFTSPAVSFAYERGWRQGFARAGFPGADVEAEMAMEYFAPCMARPNSNGTLVDMSCATGLFTRRFATSRKYKRVLGCDYSSSMLQEARRRISLDEAVKDASKSSTRLDLVRLDVGRIPMQDASVDALHAGAAMHCWPDLPAAASEIYRVLKPGGRYFATTFLSSYFGTLQQAEGGATGPSRQAFQYFGSVEQLRDLMEGGGFEREKINIEVLGNACVILRCEK